MMLFFPFVNLAQLILDFPIWLRFSQFVFPAAKSPSVLCCLPPSHFVLCFPFGVKRRRSKGLRLSLPTSSYNQVSFYFTFLLLRFPSIFVLLDFTPFSLRFHFCFPLREFFIKMDLREIFDRFFLILDGYWLNFWYGLNFQLS